MKEKRSNELKKKARVSKKMYRVADSLIECLYINFAELSNTGDSF